jgi:hypothetical protein
MEQIVSGVCIIPYIFIAIPKTLCGKAAAFCSFPGCVYTIVYLPAFAKDNDISIERTTMLLTITGVSRFSLTWITDSKRIRRCHILGTGCEHHRRYSMN